MLAKPIITLTTDFGLKGPFAGAMKGVILGINPEAEIVDISHAITPQNVFEAAQVISMSHKYFPPSTIHVAVVDPGVGGLRKPLLLVAENYYFIGPDNGVFTQIFEQYKNHFQAIHLTTLRYFRSHISSTFHGRDIFAPVAAWLSKGVGIKKFGKPLNNYVTLEFPKPELIGKSTFRGEIIYIDGFGNAMTNITGNNLNTIFQNIPMNRLKVFYKNKKLSFSNCYEEKTISGLSAIINSFGYLELFLFKGKASERFDIKIGDNVSIKKGD